MWRQFLELASEQIAGSKDLIATIERSQPFMTQRGYLEETKMGKDSNLLQSPYNRLVKPVKRSSQVGKT